VLYAFVFLRNKINKKQLAILAICMLVISSLSIFAIYHKTKERTDSASFRVFTWLSTWEMINSPTEKNNNYQLKNNFNRLS
jgi:hypothetical protein